MDRLQQARVGGLVRGRFGFRAPEPLATGLVQDLDRDRFRVGLDPRHSVVHPFGDVDGLNAATVVGAGYVVDDLHARVGPSADVGGLPICVVESNVVHRALHVGVLFRAPAAGVEADPHPARGHGRGGVGRERAVGAVAGPTCVGRDDAHVVGRVFAEACQATRRRSPASSPTPEARRRARWTRRTGWCQSRSGSR